MALIDKLTNIANAIRTKTNTTETMTLEEIPSKIENIGGDLPDKGYVVTEYDENGYPSKVEVKDITTLDTYVFGGNSTVADVSGSLAKNLQEIVLCDGITKLSSYFANRLAKLTNVTLPDSIQTIETYAFAYCSNLKLKSNKLPDNLTSLGTYAFFYCHELDLTELPVGLTSIGLCAFASCTKMVIKTLPDSITSLDRSVFNNTGIIQISMNNVRSMAGTGTTNGSFNSNTNLKAVWIGSAITSLTRYVFCGCSNLSKMYIDLPRSTVEAMGYYSYAFMNDTSKIGIIICNDDEGFMTKEEFDAIDWSTYTE